MTNDTGGRRGERHDDVTKANEAIARPKGPKPLGPSPADTAHGGAAIRSELEPEAQDETQAALERATRDR